MLLLTRRRDLEAQLALAFASARSSTSGSGARPARPRPHGRPFGPATFEQVESHLWATPGFPGLLRSRWQARHTPGFFVSEKSDEKLLRAAKRKSNPQSWPSSPETLARRKRPQLARHGSAVSWASTERAPPLPDAELGGGNGTASPTASRPFDALPNK